MRFFDGVAYPFRFGFLTAVRLADLEDGGGEDESSFRKPASKLIPGTLTSIGLDILRLGFGFT